MLKAGVADSLCQNEYFTNTATTPALPRDYADSKFDIPIIVRA